MTFWVVHQTLVLLAMYLLMGKITLQICFIDLTCMCHSIDLDIEGGGAARKSIEIQKQGEMILNACNNRLSGFLTQIEDLL